MSFLRIISVLCLSLVLSCAARAQGVITLKFDDLAALSHPLEQYNALGVHFSTGDFGVIQGVANGDPGNWWLNGTNGAYFLGYNSISGFSQAITFDFAAASVTLDVSRANGSSSFDTFTLNAYDSSNILVGTQTLTYGAINTWSTLTMSGTDIRKISYTGSYNMGIDNIRITPFTAVPEASTLALLGSGLGLLGLAGMHRKHYDR